MTKEERIQKAVALFKEGYNCSQSVVAAYADMYGFTREQALHMAASFGGGIGRMRETCGAACGMFLLAGLERCAVEGADRAGKARQLCVGSGPGGAVQVRMRLDALRRFARAIEKRAGCSDSRSKNSRILC